MNGNRYAIEAEGLEKSYGQVSALAGLSLRVRTGSVLGLLGPNGSGITYYADPACQKPDQTYLNGNRRGTYFLDPDGHLMEILTAG
jgi:ABC-type uncharacterized transport system ATPase subunit